MEDIRHRVGSNAPLAEAYDTVATREGNSRWSGRDVEGDSAVGTRLTSGFGGPDRVAVMDQAEGGTATPWPENEQTSGWA